MRAIFNAQGRSSVENFLEKSIEKYGKTVSKLTAWLDTNIQEELTVYSLPASHQRLIRNTNGLERRSRKTHLHTRLVDIYLNKDACMCFVSSILMEINDSRQAGRVYLTFEADVQSL
jgi:transposase-like protein